MKKMKVIILGILLVILTGCQGGFPEITSEGTIEGYVRDIMTNEPVASVVVKVADIQYSTGSDGYFSLYRDTKNEDERFLIPNGNGNTYSINKAGYYNKTGIVMLNFGQKNVLGYITPRPTGNKYVVSGKVTSKTNGNLENANVIINTSFDPEGYRYKAETDSNGEFMILDVPEGRINIYVYKDGYEAFSKVINLDRNWTDDKISINADVTKKYGTISGNINDVKSNACDFAKVSVGQENSAYYQFTIAGTNGNYILNGVPEGDAQISVKAPGFYKEASTSTRVTAGAITTCNVKMNYLDYEE